jgi:hypothetical protein
MSQRTVNWNGLSGRSYTYQVYLLGTKFNDVPGNYIFARWTGTGWRAIYIGQAKSLSNRISGHEVWPCANQNGATHIHAHTNQAGETAREAEEADLIAQHKPPCNTVGK